MQQRCARHLTPLTIRTADRSADERLPRGRRVFPRVAVVVLHEHDHRSRAIGGLVMRQKRTWDRPSCGGTGGLGGWSFPRTGLARERRGPGDGHSKATAERGDPAPPLRVIRRVPRGTVRQCHTVCCPEHAQPVQDLRFTRPPASHSVPRTDPDPQASLSRSSVERFATQARETPRVGGAQPTVLREPYCGQGPHDLSSGRAQHQPSPPSQRLQHDRRTSQRHLFTGRTANAVHRLEDCRDERERARGDHGRGRHGADVVRGR